MADESEGARDLKVDTDNLYREEVFTDLGAGTIRRLTPVLPDGSADSSRQTAYMGQAQVVSAMGPLPLQFQLEADSLDGAIERFPAAAEQAVKRMLDEIRELQRQQASQIVVPGAGGGLPPGMPGGGGGIKLR
ncbi:MAG: hypothetical protein GKR94_28500 [Gammaproteobacteria bacterium]|nr:hypothetical protein [Gammaproteobacteria bacterium]